MKRTKPPMFHGAAYGSRRVVRMTDNQRVMLALTSRLWNAAQEDRKLFEDQKSALRQSVQVTHDLQKLIGRNRKGNA